MYIIWILIWAVVWGAVANAIGKPKNINGFWWGFLLGLIGVIVVACMSPKTPTDTTTASVNQATPTEANGADKYEQIEKLAELKNSGALSEEEFEQEKAKLLK